MKKEEIKKIIKDILDNNITVEEALEYFEDLPFKSLDFDLKLDFHRPIRTGLEETILGLGKSKEQLEKIVMFYKQKGKKVLITKLDQNKGRFLKEKFPEGEYFTSAQLFVLNKKISLNPPWEEKGDVLIICAGSSDLKIALEALATLMFYDVSVGLICDVGIAGIHRIFPYIKNLKSAKVLIVVAGMEGALPSLIASLTDKPTIAVPTSVGYGCSFGGMAALLTMLNSCVPGIGVVNIDNGFGAAALAIRILNQLKS